MPQMMPMMWTLILLLTSASLILSMSMVHPLKLCAPKAPPHVPHAPKYWNWKW